MCAITGTNVNSDDFLDKNDEVSAVPVALSSGKPYVFEGFRFLTVFYEVFVHCFPRIFFVSFGPVTVAREKGRDPPKKPV